jgi:hypothetical protein
MPPNAVVEQRSGEVDESSLRAVHEPLAVDEVLTLKVSLRPRTKGPASWRAAVRVARSRYFPRTERGKSIEVFALTLLVADLMPRLVAVFREDVDLVLDLALRCVTTPSLT